MRVNQSMKLRLQRKGQDRNAAYNRKPAWIPKGRKEQACVVKAVDLELEQAAIVVFNEERKEEVYMVPLNSIRPRVGI